MKNNKKSHQELIFEKGAYKGLSSEEIKGKLRKDGLRPELVNEPANTSESPHTHAQGYVVVHIRGSMTVSSTDRDYEMQPGDKITIPPEVDHTADFGGEGSQYLWAEYAIIVE